MKRSLLITMLLSFLLGSSCVNKNEEGIDVLIIGGGASGVSAGIQASRLGAKTLIPGQQTTEASARSRR